MIGSDRPHSRLGTGFEPTPQAAGDQPPPVQMTAVQPKAPAHGPHMEDNCDLQELLVRQPEGLLRSKNRQYAEGKGLMAAPNAELITERQHLKLLRKACHKHRPCGN